MGRIIVTTSWDDGHKLDLKIARLLTNYGIKGTFYISPENHELGKSDRLSKSEIVTLSKDHEIGAHTLTHPNLRKLTPYMSKKNIASSKSMLETFIGHPVTSFCYPYGYFTKRTVRIVRQLGFTYARTTERYKTNIDNHLTAGTTVHAYSHKKDLLQIARFARFNPFVFMRYLDWSNLAIAQFDAIQKTGGIFHLWGHSWEIDKHGDWQRLDKVLRHIAHHEGAEYVTNSNLGETQQPSLLIVSPYFPPATGGLERYAFEMAKGALSKGYKVAVFTSSSDTIASVEHADGMTIYRQPSTLRISNTPINFGWYKKIKQVLDIVQPDIINVHTPVPFISDLTTMIAKDTPVVVTYHSGSMAKGKPIIDIIIKMYERFVLPAMLNKSEQIITSSDHTKDLFLKGYSRKTKTITPGVESSLFTHISTLRKTNRVLFIGDSTNQVKGFDYLRKAVADLPDTELLVIGKYNKIETPKTTFFGELHGHKLVEAIHQASVVVLPSISEAESFGMVLIEAMACGIPVIGSRIGGVPNVINDGIDGLLVEPANITALRKAIVRILNNPELADRLAKNAYEKILKNYTWQNKKHEYCEVLDTIINRENQLGPRVTVISSEYPPYVEGGLGIHYKYLCDSLKNYADVTVIATRTDLNTPKFENVQGLHIRRIYSPNIFPLNHLVINVMSWIVSSRQASDIQHICAPFGIFNVLIKTRPTVVKIHSLYSGQGGTFIYRHFIFALAAFMDKLMIRFADQVMTTSKFMRKGIVQQNIQIDPHTIKVINNGIAKSWLVNSITKQHARLQLNIKPSAFVVLNVGRFIERKGTLQLVKSFKLLHDKHPNTELILIGGGFNEGANYAKEVIDFIQDNSLNNNVRVLEWMDSDQIRAYYNAADLYAHAATYEPFGNVILEAMASGLPVMAVRAGGPEEICGKNAVLLKDNEVNTLLNALLKFVEDSSYTVKYSKLSLIRVRSYSWDETAKSTVKAYEELLI